MAEYKEVPGYPDYVVSDNGVVWSRKIRGSRHGNIGLYKPMKFKVTRTGYFCVNLYREKNKPERKYVHQLVLACFVGQQPPGSVTRHLNGNRLDNRLENLVYGTHKENMEDAFKHGDVPVGEQRKEARFTNAQIRAMRLLKKSGKSYQFLAEKYSCSKHYVCKIVTREIWKHV